MIHTISRYTNLDPAQPKDRNLQEQRVQGAGNQRLTHFHSSSFLTLRVNKERFLRPVTGRFDTNSSYCENVNSQQRFAYIYLPSKHVKSAEF